MTGLRDDSIVNARLGTTELRDASEPPPEDYQVLAWLAGEGWIVAHRDEGQWRSSETYAPINPTSWCELPATPTPDSTPSRPSPYSPLDRWYTATAVFQNIRLSVTAPIARNRDGECFRQELRFTVDPGHGHVIPLCITVSTDGRTYEMPLQAYVIGLPMTINWTGIESTADLPRPHVCVLWD